MELNPNHKVTESSRDQWHKYAAILMSKFGQNAVEITIEDVQRLADSCIVVDARDGKLVLRLMSMAEGEKLANEEGGLPI